MIVGTLLTPSIYYDCCTLLLIPLLSYYLLLLSKTIDRTHTLKNRVGLESRQALAAPPVALKHPADKGSGQPGCLVPWWA